MELACAGAVLPAHQPLHPQREGSSSLVRASELSAGRHTGQVDLTRGPHPPGPAPAGKERIGSIKV